LQKYTKPLRAPPSVIALRSRLSLESTLGDSTGWPTNFAKFAGASNVGSGETSALDVEVNA